ncbi:MAG TPA: glycosyltransferase [Candidatus Limnocylindria bacterium]|nr:glycosyltransferase [Candidatus Limnocylindria bacterium]
MRIGLLSDTFLPVVDGVGRVTVAYANTLARMGHEVTVCTPAYDTGHRGAFPYEIVDYWGMKVPTYPQYRTGSPALDAHYRRRMEQIGLDIVHAHSPFASGTEALRLAKQREIPAVITFHSKYYDDFLKATRSESVAKALVARVVRLYKRYDEVWALSNPSGEVLREYGYKGPMHVMPNGAEPRETTPEKIAEVSGRFGLGDWPVFLFVGQINWKKNLLRILEAASILKNDNPGFRLVFAGMGQDMDALKHKIAELGLSDQAVLTGMISDVPTLDALYARAALFTFPSLYDNFAMVIREAAMMGTPSAVVEGSCSAESIVDGVNGYFCRDDAQSLRGVMRRVLENPQEAREIGRKARQTIPIPWDTVMRDVVARYEYLIRRKQELHGFCGVPGQTKDS